MTHRRRILQILIIPLFLAQPFGAQAAAVCEKLRERLASTTEVIGTTAAVRKYANAIAQQNLEIRKTRSDLRRMGCGGGGSIVAIGEDSDRECDAIEETLQRMEENKRILMGKRTELQRGGGLGSDARHRLLAALDANGCDDAPPAADTAIQSTSIEEIRPARTVAHGSFVSAAPQTPYLNSRDEPFADNLPAGGLRTVCVRTCDGAFFPISSGASPQMFRRDANLCAMMCAGTQTELFYHSILTQESSEMVSAVTGEPYTALPTAFSYRNRPAGQKSACGCDLAAFHQEMLRREKALKFEAPQQYSSITDLRGNVEPQATVMDDAAKPVPSRVPADRPYDPATAKVRRVGPQFLADDSNRIDLRNPGIVAARPDP